MKKNNGFIFVAIILVFVMAFGIGCQTSRPKRLETINALYLDIKTIITDPAIKPMIPPGKLKRLADLERKYLAAVSRLKASKVPDDKVDLAIIAECGSKLLGIVNSLVLEGKYSKELEAIKLGVKLLRNHLA